MSKIFVNAVRLLARREHGAYELTQKLLKKGYVDAEIQDVILECQRLGLQSDARFTENLCRARIRQGYGPQRIRQDLQNVQIDRELIEQVLGGEQEHWLSYARDVWLKKYEQSDDRSYPAIQKQKQFLLYRGFSMDTIAMVFKEKDKVGWALAQHE